MTNMDPARLAPAPQPDAPDGMVPRDAWLRLLDGHAMEHGFHARLGENHGALYTEDDESVLLVSFEDSREIRRRSPALPYGLTAAGKLGWSQLTIFSDGDTWFRDTEVYAFMDDLVDGGFFDLFDTVLFYGVGAGGYAACAFSVAAPFSRVLAIRPQATLDPARAGWDRRFLSARRLSFSDRYGDAATLLDASERAAIVYDPLQREDAMHATLFGSDVLHLKTPMLGTRPETFLEPMGVVDGLLKLLAKDRLSAEKFAHLYRRRHKNTAYLKRVLAILEREKRPWLQGLWCRGGLRKADRPRLQEGLTKALAELDEDGKSLPPPRLSSDLANEAS